jgi:hypothetical protein
VHLRSRVARTEERRRRLPCIGGCLRFYQSRIGSENLHCGLAVVFVVYILPVERATCHIGLAHTGLLCGMSALRLGRCGAFGTLSARSELRLISPRRWPFPLVAYLALLVRRNGSGGCLAQGVA